MGNQANGNITLAKTLNRAKKKGDLVTSSGFLACTRKAKDKSESQKECELYLKEECGKLSTQANDTSTANYNLIRLIESVIMES